MKLAAAIVYGVAFLFEALGIANLVRDAKRVRDGQVVEPGPATYLRNHALESPAIARQELDAVERAGIIDGWPLKVIIAGLVLGFAGNYLSLFA
ncbi:hypothetical protein [Jatrophihabitans sp.]|uniref:hypothetical protein n=1 Tax=Jatrophihabitans sp. TaxID=1932789 RepID=UPI0030C6D5E6|nr:hypothetical protein [Jatrophihabitans sp.]